MKREDLFIAYVDSFRHASDRLRYVLIITVVASTLVFVGLWNTLEFGWSMARMENLRTAVRYELWNQEAVPVPGEDRERVERVRSFLDARGLESREVVVAMLRSQQRFMIENIAVVRVPALGIVIDVNDLGVFGGFTFSVILMWAAFSLYQLKGTQEIITRSFVRVRKDDPGAAKEFGSAMYHVFAMGQVLNTPPTVLRPRLGRVRWIPRSLFLLPLGVHTLVLLHDASSWLRAWTVSPLLTLALAAMELFWWSAIAALTVVCFRFGTRIDQNWVRAFRLTHLTVAVAGIT